MFILNTIISGGPGLFFVVVLWTLFCKLHQINLHTSWSRFCRLFFKQRENPLLKQYNTTKGQFFDSPTGLSLLSTFYPPGLTPVIKSNRPDFHALLSGSVIKAGFLLGIFVVLSFANINAATIKSTATGGDWSSGTTWVGGAVPASGDDVSIPAGSTVTIDTNPIVGSLSVFGTLQFEVTTARSLTVLTQVTINSGGVFQSAQSGTVKNHQLIVQGSVINDGKIDFSSSLNATGVEIVFTGSNNAIFNCSDAPLTNLKQNNGIVLNKGTSAASVLSFTPGNTFQVLSDGSSNAKGFLSVINGTFNIIGSNSFSNPVFNIEGDYTIPATGGFWLGNQNATVIGMNGTVTNLGELKITNGTYQVGISGGSSLENLADGQFIMSGGALNVAGNFKMEDGNASISGGRINLGTQANSADQVPALHISGQAIFEVYGNPIITIAYPNSKEVLFNDIQIETGSGQKLVTGGAIQLGTEVTPAGSSFFVSGDPVINRLTVLNECTIQVFNTSKSDLATTPISALPKIAFDKIAPELTAPQKTTIQCGENLPKSYASLQEFINAGGAATDNCTLETASFKLVEQVQSSMNCPYTITRTYQISDASGNVGTTKHLIVVEGQGVGPQPEVISESPVKEELKLKSAMAVCTASSGNWNSTSTWSCGTIPTSLDDVIVPNGVTVTVDAAAFCKDITIDAGGTLNYTGTNTLTVNGNWTNNGTYNAGTNGIIEFAGTNPATIGGTSTTIFKQFIVNKGALANIVQVISNIQLDGDITFTSGTMQVNTGVTVNCTHNSGFTIEQPAGLRILGTFSSGAFSIDNKGVFEVAGGIVNLGTIAGNSLTIRSSGDFILSSGQINIAGRLELSGGDAVISGGTLNINTVGNNSVSPSFYLSPTSTLNMTSGNIVFKNPNSAGNLDMYIEQGGGKTFTGGTITFGTGTTGTYRISSEIIPFPSNISAASNANLILKLFVTTTGSYNFPLVTNAAAIPATINLTGGTIAANASIQIETTGTDHPNNASATNYLNRYWTVTTSGITSPVYDVTATYADADIAGTEAEIAFGNWTGSLPWIKGPNATTGSNTISKTGITSVSFVFAGITSDPPTVTITATSSSICNGASTTLTANPVGDPTFTYIWASNPAGFTSTLQSVSVTPLVNTTYTVIVTDGNGFTATNNIAITVLPDNTVALSSAVGTNVQAKCINTAITNITYTTTGATGATFSGLPAGVNGNWAGNVVTISGTPTVSGTFNYTVTLTGGCGNITANGTITVNPLPIATAGSNTPLCAGQTLNLTASGGTSYSWTGPNGFTSTQQNPSISNVTTAASGTYTVTVTDGNGCSAAASTSVTVNPAPAVSITASPGNVICSGDNVTFTASPTNAGLNPSYQWQINGVNVSGETNPTFSSSTLANAQQVKVVVTADPSYCSSTAVSNIYTMTVNPPVIPTVTILESANPICAGTTVNFSSIVVNGGSTPTYQWQSSPDGTTWTNISGATAASFSSSTLVNGDRVRVVVTSNATCAINNPATSGAVIITVNPLEIPTVSITADQTTICPGTSVTFTATPTYGGSNPSYQWKVNGTNVGSNSSIFTTATLVNGDIISVVMTSNAPCASPTFAPSNNITMIVNPGTPAIPGAIAGTNPACPALTGQIYSVAAVPNATSYNWTVPTGWSITSGAGTNSITVTTGATGQNGTILVTASNSCGTSPARSLAVTVNPGTPATPGAITGTTPVCPAITGLTYSITAVPNATSYTWTVPTGWTITSGAGTNAITVTSGSAGQNGDITVTATNSCGTSAASTLPVVVSPGIPAQPAAISGTTPVCPAIPGLTYSIATVPNATSYTWTVPTGWSITAGSGTNSITVTAGAAGQNGNITVTATNSCGTSPASTLAVTVGSGIPATPGAITGTANQCINSSGLIYSIAAVPNATYYTWTLPSGWTGTSTTNSITLATTGTAVSGNITVTASNSCGTSSATTLAVTVSAAAPVAPATPSPKIGQVNTICPVAVGLEYWIPVVPNATSYVWNFPAGWTITSGQGTTSVTVTANLQTIGSKNITVTAVNSCGSATSPALVVSVGVSPYVNAGSDIYVCAGSTTAQLNGAIGGGTGSNDWNWSAPSGSFNPNDKKLDATYNIPVSIQNGGSVIIRMNAGAEGTCLPIYDEVVVTVLPNPTASISGNATICSGSSSTITFTATPNTTVTYTVSGVAGSSTINVGASGTATLTTAALTANTTYTLTNVAYTTAPACSQTASGSVLITVNPAATVNAGGPDVVCQSATPSSITLAGASVGGGATTGAWSIISGGGTLSSLAQTATPATVTYTPAANYTGTVTLTLTTNAPGACAAVSATRIITVNAAPTVNAGGSDLVCQSATPSAVTLAGASVGGGATTGAWSITSGGGTLSSQAQTATPATVTYTPAANFSGTVTLTLTTNAPGACAAVNATRTIIINPLATANAGPDQTVCATSPVTLAGSVGGGASTGTWSGGTGTFSPNASTLTATYTPSAAEISDGIVLLTLTTNDPDGPCGAVSDQVQITISLSPTVNAGLDQILCEGSNLILSGTVGGSASSGTWSGGSGTFSPNATTLNATYTPGVGETGLVTLTLTTNDPVGTCSSVSDQLVLTIDPKPMVNAGVNQTICSDVTITLNGSFSGAASASWSTSGNGTFSPNSTTSNAVYTPGSSDIFNGTVTLTYETNDPAGPCGPASASITLTIKDKIVITTQPVNTGVCSSYPANITVAAVGDDLSYQWYKGVAPGGTQVVNSSNISGAQSATLHFNNATAGDAGSYYVVISGATECAPVTSSQVTLNVDEEITITTQVQSNSVCVGDPVTFSLEAEPGGLLTFQWRKNGINLTGQTSNTLNLGNVTLADAGGYDVLIQGLAGYTCSSAQSAVATLTVNEDGTIALSGGNASPTLCVNTSLTAITYAIGGSATGASITAGALPAGVTGTYNSGTFTISGSPTVSGTFNYTVTTQGPCINNSLSGTITVNPDNTIALTSGNNVQILCISAALTDITYTTTGAAGATFSGLPAGINGNFAGGNITISGTPTAGGTFNYTITLTGGCGTVTATGTITVTPVNTISLTSAAGTDNQAICINTVLTSITYATTGATGATVSGLPAGVTGLWAGNVVTISGTPSASGTFNYTVTLTGGCGTVSETGTITVTPDNTITLTSANNNQTVCINTALTNITYSSTGATNANFSGLPSGVSGNYSGGNIAISGTPTASGTFNYTVTLTGGCGVATATGTITVTPNNTISLSSAPGTNVQALCTSAALANITYATTGATGATVTGLPGGVTGTWASNVVTISGTPATNGTFNYTVTLTGGCGNVTATGTITISDTVAPVFNVCPATLTVPVDAGLCTTTIIPAALGTPTVSDNCTATANLVVTNNFASQFPTGQFSPGTYTVTWTVRDQSNNTGTCTQTIIVRDNQVPVITCPVAPIPKTADPGVCSTSVTILPVTATDNCTGITFSWTLSGATTRTGGGANASGTYNVGNTTVLYSARDASGNTSTCSIVVTVTDNEGPMITGCATSTIYANAAPGTCSATVTWTVPVPSDNCSYNPNQPGAWIPSAIAPGSSFPVGTTTITYTAKDRSDNITVCSFRVIVYDTEKPVISNCPSNITMNNGAGSCTATVTWTPPTATDVCTPAGVTLVSDYPSGYAFPIGTTPVTYTATDAAGNKETCSFNVTVADTEKPVIVNCPVNITQNNDPGQCNAVINWTEPTVTDNCTSAGEFIWTYSLRPGATFLIGTTTVTYSVLDKYGNASLVCSFTVTVIDNEASVLTCPGNVSVSATAGRCDANVTIPPATFYDNCPGGSISNNYNNGGPNASGVYPIGVTTVTYTVTDAGGNKMTCSITVTVTDTEDPTINCPSNITATAAVGTCGATVSVIANVADNCSGVTISNTFNGGGANASGTYPVGTTTVTFTATDAAGNTNACSVLVTVLDNQKPVISCPGDVTAIANAVSCNADVTVPVATATDNCSTVTITNNHNSGGANASGNYTIGTTTVTFTATDAAGNQTTCNMRVIVTDNQAPVITCPAAITKTADPGKCNAVVTVPLATVTDNCAGSTIVNNFNSGGANASGTYPVGTTTVVYTATDAAGNTSICSVGITITDNESPVPDIINLADFSGDICEIPITVNTPTATDNCSGVIAATTTDPTTYTLEGNFTITWKYTDVAGNTSSQVQAVHIISSGPPVPTIANLPTITGQCSATVTVTPTAVTSCSSTISGTTTNSLTYTTQGTHIITWSYSDGTTTVTQTQAVIVKDTDPPVITCTAAVTATANAGSCEASVAGLLATAIDGCSTVVTITNSYNSNGANASGNYPVGTTTVTFTATDEVGNSSTCQVIVKVTDSDAPQITCTSPITQSAAAGKCEANVTLPVVTATDNCTAVTITNDFNAGGANASGTYPFGTTTVKFTATDAAGNTKTCTVDITVADNEAPVVNCPANITRPTDPGKCEALVTIPSPGAFDNCSTVTITNSYNAGGANASGIYPAGITTVKFTAIDAEGNSASCSVNITVTDNEAPVKPTFTPLTSQCAISLVAPTTTDNCSGGTITGTTPTAFPYTTKGTSIIVWTFIDANGNFITADQIVTINDTESPVFVNFPTTASIGCNTDNSPVVTGMPTVTDNCGTATATYTDESVPGVCIGRSTINRTWVATDASGNTTSRVQTINVTDTTPPVISCTSFTNFDANMVPSSDLHTGVSAADNCSPSGLITFELISEEYFGLDVSAGWCPTSLERVYVAMDACGNVSGSCTQTYTFTNNPDCQACIDDPNTIEDNVPFFPVIFTQPDQSWTSPNVVRNGICCFAEGPPPPRCISFNVYLDKDAVGLIFTIPTGAIPGGALYYHVDCGPPQKVGEVLCLSGGRFYTITFCEPGNNPNTYSIQSISGAATTEDIITRADANCIKNIVVTGLANDPTKITWTVKFPTYANADTLLSRLSCTDCLTPVFTPINILRPPSFTKYAVRLQGLTSVVAYQLLIVLK